MNLVDGREQLDNDGRRRKRRRRVIWASVALGMAAVIVVGMPILRLIVVAVSDATHPLEDTPAPHAALPPPGEALPPGRLVFSSNRTGNFEIFTMASDGSDVRRLTDDPARDSWWPRLSPNRTRVLFYRAPNGTHDGDATKNSLWVMNADGSQPLEIRPPATDGWRLQAHAEWSPDGTSMVMLGGSRLNPQIYLTTSSGRRLRNLTHRPGSNLDPSWSPDGRTVYFVGCPGAFCTERRYEIYAIAVDGGDPVRLTHDNLRDHDPYASPDGRRVAWLTETSTRGIGEWNIRIADADGSRLDMVTDDRQVNSRPEWSRDGSLIYFHRLEIGKHSGFSIFSIRPDGTRLTELTPGSDAVNEYPGT